MVFYVQTVDDLVQLAVFDGKSSVTKWSRQLFHKVLEILCLHIMLTLFIEVRPRVNE